MRRIGEYIGCAMVVHAILVGGQYAIILIREPGPSSAIGLAMLAGEFVVGIALWNGVRRRVGGLYRLACRIGLIGVAALAVARYVERAPVWPSVGELVGIGIPLLLALLAFFAYSRSVVRSALPGYCDHCGHDLSTSTIPVCGRCERCTSERLNKRIHPARLKHCLVSLTAPKGVDDPLTGVDLTRFVVHKDQCLSAPNEGLRVEDVRQRVWICNYYEQADDGRARIHITTGDGARTSLDLLVRLHDMFVAAGFTPNEPDEIALYREILSEGRKPGDWQNR